MNPRPQHSHRLFAPEVVQTSAMDCGPAALKCLLEGHGIHVSYARLRDACQTDVDGTSIDTMEALANQLGLVAEQVPVPIDHVVLPEAHLLPAIAVVTLAERQTHFVVIWRRHGPIVQVMDPSGGRRWTTVAQLLSELYRHRSIVPAEDWRTWAGSDEFTAGVVRRLTRAGLAPSRARDLMRVAASDPAWESLARLDAAARLAQSLIDAGSINRRHEATAIIERLISTEATRDAIPDRYWSAAPASPTDDGTAQLEVRGAVLVSVRGRSVAAVDAAEQDVPATAVLTSVLEPRPRRPFLELIRLLRHDARIALSALFAAGLFASVAVVVEALLFRAALDLTWDLKTADQRLLGMSALVGFVALLAVFDFSVCSWTIAAGRRLETRLRIAFFEKARTLGDRYFHSRLTSDIASRVHSLHTLRDLPPMADRAIRICGEIAATTAALLWIDPSGAVLALALAAASSVPALLATPVLSELDMRMRTHAGALSRYYLDALLGLVPLRVHGAERALRREHRRVVQEWMASGASLVRAAVGTDTLQLALGYGLAAWLLLNHLARAESLSLLLVFWALRLPVLGEELAQLGRLYPPAENIMLRVLEPLSASGETRSVAAPSAQATTRREPVAIAMRNIAVQAAGRTILKDIDLDIVAGSHVAVVGRSGAGKSTLIGLLLGWHKASSGALLIDGQDLDDSGLDELRRRTVWVDPAVHLWNQSLLANIQYGNRSDAGRAAGFAVAAADLQTLVQKLPQGLQTSLGEGGTLVSGGEGQRVRLARGLLREEARLVILDEPFRGLTRESRHALMEAVRREWRHATLLCISHDIAETLDFDRVVVIDDGHVVEDGVPRELADAETRYRELLIIERGVREQLWSDPRWRRLRIDDGRLSEIGAAGQ